METERAYFELREWEIKLETQWALNLRLTSIESVMPTAYTYTKTLIANNNKKNTPPYLKIQI